MTIGGRVVELRVGDITEIDCDAIVNAANSRLGMGGGVAGAIKRKGGTVIEDEAVRRGPIPVGAAVVTTAGALRARRVIHAAVMAEDLKTDREKIYQATRSSLEQAAALKLKSIAFPALGTGVGGFPKTEAARAMLDAIKDSAEENSSIETITIVLYDRETFTSFENVLTQSL